MLILDTGLPLCEACCRAFAADPRGYWPEVRFIRIHEGGHR